MSYTFEDMLSAYIRGFLSTSWKWNGDSDWDFEDAEDARQYFTDELKWDIDNGRISEWTERFDREEGDDL